MANPKKPEQRSSSGSGNAQPTGEEVYDAAAPASAETPADTDEPDQTSGETGPHELSALAEDLREQAARLYANGRLYAEGRATPLIGVGFMIGLVIGMISSRA